MAITQRLDLRQSQSLVMTPQLQQAIKLLQMSSHELVEFIDKEIEQNPLLEAGSPNTEGGEVTEPGGEIEIAKSDGEAEPLSGDAASGAGDDNPVDKQEDWGSDERISGTGTQHYDDDYDALQNVAERPSLREHLLEQIHVDFHDPAHWVIATALMELLDENGYLPRDLEVVRAQLGAEPAQFLRVITKLQTFDPPGIFARSLQECLAAQLRDKNRLDPAMDALLHNLDLLAKRDRTSLMRLCGVDAEDLADMIDEIRTLNPKPAASFNADVAVPVVPDVVLRATPQGWAVELNNDTLPRVLANEKYYSEIRGSARTKADKDYVNERWQQANWLVKALHQRATTILKVATEIVKQQDKFFTHGVQHLRPLILRDIATAVEMHESTVSRVTQNKYIATPRGLFELKYFFTTALARTDGAEAVSSEAVRERIRILIDSEEPTKILSDDKIAEILKGEGVDVARRTVAKYREAMGLGSSSERRRVKRDNHS